MLGPQFSDAKQCGSAAKFPEEARQYLALLANRRPCRRIQFRQARRTGDLCRIYRTVPPWHAPASVDPKPSMPLTVQANLPQYVELAPQPVPTAYRGQAIQAGLSTWCRAERSYWKSQRLLLFQYLLFGWPFRYQTVLKPLHHGKRRVATQHQSGIDYLAPNHFCVS